MSAYFYAMSVFLSLIPLPPTDCFFAIVNLLFPGHWKAKCNEWLKNLLVKILIYAIFVVLVIYFMHNVEYWTLKTVHLLEAPIFAAGLVDGSLFASEL
eukprot:CAMPEP_0201282894 /NCGR_PEP_ID=MMETSP1317-20130820/6987_1 /ASSEMBLY_ACC=CAM_ASM_000770 /TAXON_ID=187299 /ORGANISM="Undescribed Undescribed, Strain Undescribed" /LENGTH=97 /DNA_ID=CAMNT_0047597167 /DNA_START=332 /DNA_END=626 /DNA_ORIENTATION=-